MRNTLFTAVLACVAFVGGVALADRVVTYRRADARINVVELRSADDGGVSLTANVHFDPADGGAGYDRAATCDVAALTSAQRTCLVGIRNVAVACVADAEGL